MNKKTKLVLGLIALVVVIGGSTVLYRTLTKGFAPELSLGPVAGAGQPGAATPGEAESSSAPEPMLAPDFSLEDAEGNTVKLSDFVGKPVVVNFWASWCPPCKAEMPDFERVYEELGEEVHFLMVNATDGARETKEKAQAFLAKQGFTFPVYYDTAQEAVYTYGVSSLPSTMFIDKDGYLITGAVGMIDESSLRRGIELITPAPPAVAETAVAAADMVVENPSWCTIEPEYVNVDAENAKSLMEEGLPFTLLDVRTQAEFDEGHIEGAILIPDTELRERAEAELPDKTATILIYCRSGRRSEQAAKALVEMGYNHVYDFGGIQDWPYGTVL